MDAHSPDASAERLRLAEDSSAPSQSWRDWGPYVAERAWGSVREDYSADGNAWASFPHDHARSRAYRWNEDGMAGFCDRDQNWCLSLALWNGQDPILKERMFGLTGPEGNHGEDVKEYWWYDDATPTHSWNSWRYHYPQSAFPYDDLISTNAARGKSDPEYELVDTGVFDESRYWVVTVDYAKASEHDLLMRITIENAGPQTATVRVLPTLWFRNTWSWGYPENEKPALTAASGQIAGTSAVAGNLRLAGDGAPALLFCENETNTQRLWGTAASTEWPKDGINDHVVSGAATVNPAETGTKAALDYSVTLDSGASTVIRVRLTDSAKPILAAALAKAFDAMIMRRQSEADEFWADATANTADETEAQIVRQSLAGLLWSKQFYHFDVKRWLDGDPAFPPPPPERREIRNSEWRHLNAHDVILMPDTWEYPWFAAWDLSFHCVTLAHIDPEFAKAQLILILREWYTHPNGQLPAYEWNFADVNPPTHAWAALQVFTIDGEVDFTFLAKVFHKLLMNFTWWTNNKEDGDSNLFDGGFMGLDNIAPLDRSTLPESIGTLEQADSTAWMAMYALDLLHIALRLAANDDSYEDVAVKFAEHFLRIAASVNDSGMWDENDAYFYDILHLATGADVPLKVRSLVGLVPVVASFAYNDELVENLAYFRERLTWFIESSPEYSASVFSRVNEAGSDRLLALVSPERLVRILTQVFDEDGLLSAHGIRGISAYHRDNPFVVTVNGASASVDYEPAESTTGLFGGNSNWRGPVWFPLNVLLIEALRAYDSYAPGTFMVEFPLGSGTMVPLDSAADALSNRLISLFRPAEDGRRPADARYALLSADPRWQSHLLFYEYFDGDTGEGLGASHQTGWTALVAHLILRKSPQKPRSSQPRSKGTLFVTSPAPSTSDRYDVIVIGSGPAGGTTAAELAKTGKRILLIERGDFLPRERANWDSKEVFAENRYVAHETFYDLHDKPFRPELHYYVGGNSKVYGAALFRLTPADFGGIQHPGGLSPEWPISYDDLEPYYVKAEHMYWVHGKHGEDPFAGAASQDYAYPPVKHEARIQELSDGLTGMGLHPFHLPVGVNLIQNADGTAASGSPCIRCDRVDGFPCLVEAKADAESVAIRPALVAHPNLRLLTGTTVTKLLTDPAGRTVTGVVATNAAGDETTFSADIVVLSAGSILSSALLLASASDAHPNGLANGSDVVGRHYMRHNNLALIAFSKDRNDTVFQKTLSLNDFYGPSDKWEYPMGNIQMLGKSDDWQVKGQAPKGLGWAPPAAYGIVGKHSMDFWLASEDLPLPDSRVSLRPDGSVKLTVQPDNNAEGLARLRHTFDGMLTDLGMHSQSFERNLYLSKAMDVSATAHQAGTARFGTDPRTSALDVMCKAHEVDNLYVVDGSFMPSIGAVNPTLTIIANALRVSEHIAARLG